MYNNYYQSQIALVTGGGSGIGRGLCIRLAQAGATVICTDININIASETVTLIANKSAEARKLDVTNLTEFEAVIGEIVARHGKIDVMFNNAGIAINGELRDIQSSDWRQIIDVNVYGVVNGSQIAYKQMLKQGFGQIVNTASAAGLVEDLALMGPYSLTKHSVVNYTRILRLEAMELGIKASVVCPGFVNTSIGVNSVARNASKAWEDYSIKLINKGMSADEAADIILGGVQRNKAVIAFPASTKSIVLFARLFRGIFRAGMQKQLKEFRAKYRINE